MVTVKKLIEILEKADPEMIIDVMMNPPDDSGTVVGLLNLAYPGGDGKFYLGCVSNTFMKRFYELNKTKGKFVCPTGGADELEKALYNPVQPKNIEEIIEEIQNKKNKE